MIGKEMAVNGFKIKCPICGGLQFYSRETAISASENPFLNFNFASEKTINYICCNCKYIYWFLQDKE